MINESAKIAILLLAAGSSSRMGQSKQLLTIQGEPLLLRTAKSALQSNANQVAVVLGANADQHEEVIKTLPVTIIVNEEWKNGMGSSIKAGLNHLMNATPALNAVLILVCDQPLLTTALLDEIISSYLETKKKIISSFYGGSLGVPAFFDQSLFPKLLQLEDQQGAKKVILGDSDQAHFIQWPEGEVDLDTWEEYLKFNSNVKSG